MTEPSGQASEAVRVRRARLRTWVVCWTGLFLASAAAAVFTGLDEIAVAAAIALGMVGGGVFGAAADGYLRREA